MTISTQANSVTVSGTGSANSFSFSFIADSASDISITYTNANGIENVLSPSQYTLTINPPTINQLWGIGGSVIYPISGSPIAIGTTLTITRTLPLTQEVSIQNQGNFYAQVTEQALDILEMQIQQIQNTAGQALHIPTGETSNTLLPPAVLRANQALLFDVNGNVVVGQPSGGGAPISAAMQPVVAAPTINSALQLLGITPSIYTAATLGGTANAIVVETTIPQNFILNVGIIVSWTPAAYNTGAVTFAVTPFGVPAPVLKITYGGLVPLIAGDNVPGIPNLYQWNGTDWIYINLPTVGYETTVSTNQNIALANNLTPYVNTSAITYTIAQSTTLVSSFNVSIFALGGAATIAINGSDKINGGSTGSGLIISKGMSGVLTTDGNGNLYLSGTAVNTLNNFNAITGNLPTNISGNSTTAQATISSGLATDSTNTIVLTGAGYTWFASNGNAANGTDASGATLNPSTTYHMYLYSGVSGTCSYCSQNIYPVGPTGYTTYKRRIFSFRTNGSGSPIPYTAIEVEGGSYVAWLATQALDQNGPTISNTGTALPLASVPTGIKVQPLIRANLNTSAVSFMLLSGDEAIITPIQAANNQWTTVPGADQEFTGGVGPLTSYTSGLLTTNTSGQIIGVSSGSATIYIVTRGFKDWRRN